MSLTLYTGIMAGTKAQAELYAAKNHIKDYVYVDSVAAMSTKTLRCVYLVGSFYFNRDCSAIISYCHSKDIPYYEDKTGRVPIL